MEGKAYLYVNVFYKYQEKWLSLKNYIFYIMEANNETIEKQFHVKNLTLVDREDNGIGIHHKYNESDMLYLKFACKEDKVNWKNAISIAINEYSDFINQNFENYKYEFMFNYDELDIITSLMEKIESKIESITVENNLEQFLSFQNNLICNLSIFINEVDSFHTKLNKSNSLEFQISNKLKEIKEIFLEIDVNFPFKSRK